MVRASSYPGDSGVSNSPLNCCSSDLSGTNSIRADLIRADLSGAKLNGADLYDTSLRNLDLSTAKGLEEVRHAGPSSIGIDTLFLSKGGIPEKFLRVCGLSDLQIEFAKLARPGLDGEEATTTAYEIANLYTGRGTEFYSCFISDNDKDNDFAQKLHNDLQDNGVRC